jgi:methanethiol oxidase
VAAGKYGSSLYIWDWNRHEMIQEIDLGQEGLIPLEVRFLHEPSAPHAYVGAALSSNVIHVGLKTMDGHTEPVQGTKLPGIWEADVAIKQPWVKVEGWVLPEMPPLITGVQIRFQRT